jgi:hypothetical protein
MNADPGQFNKQLMEPGNPEPKKLKKYGNLVSKGLPYSEIRNHTVVHTLHFRLETPTKCLLLFAGSGPDAGEAVV